MSQPFLGLSAADVKRLQGEAGAPFREFMKSLIRAHMATVGVPSTAFSSDATNMGDGGCDAEVSEAAKSDPSGHLDTPTCWQFKGYEANLTDNALSLRVPVS